MGRWNGKTLLSRETDFVIDLVIDSDASQIG